ncbi:hypothetical protein FP2506_09776 [Fulvimarina pelagi HTCC2506]|uniref:GlcNAc-PI de-N-acetylase n=1 Tax=Fulvimarina pelagi HTCC2506 TaxID=314231 RepID=Q0G5E1_9HYPH|nr:hypothetical protein [Fulvimarina pelagi]EAU43123.1 hypothetical protein FP2506_09776 [Fulvimarina pelagi HTCC2506]
MTERPAFLENSVIIGAHPDDEMLWFGSIVKDVDAIILVYRDFWADPARGPARAEALANHPHKNLISLDLAEAGTYGCADWSNPALSERGIGFSVVADLREVKRQVKQTIDRLAPLDLVYARSSIRNAYAENYDSIYAALKQRLSSEMNVFTHNPWGEYGHEDHVQLFRVLEALEEEIGFTLWISNYCTDRSLPLAMRYFGADHGGFVRLPVDKAHCDLIADVYREAGCWTWSEDWRWFDEECFIRAPKQMSARRTYEHLMPMNIFSIEDPRSRWSWGKLAATVPPTLLGVGYVVGEFL